MMRISIVTRRRSRLIATARRRQIRCAIVAGAVLALTLSGDIGASAQTNKDPANTTAAKVYGPKQVGPWAVSGWVRDGGPYCTAERPLPGAAGRGATLQYIIAQSRAGYWLGLGSLDWELKSNASFPVELSAEPVLRSDANAVTLGANLAGIQLGSDRQLMQKLATVSAIEVKAARRTFKLPVDAFDRAVVELDACFGAIKQSENPFSATEPAAKQPATPPSPPAPSTPSANSRPGSPPAATSSTGSDRDTELTEERTFLTVPGSKGSHRLEALVVRPAKGGGPPSGRVDHAWQEQQGRGEPATER